LTHESSYQAGASGCVFVVATGLTGDVAAVTGFVAGGVVVVAGGVVVAAGVVVVPAVVSDVDGVEEVVDGVVVVPGAVVDVALDPVVDGGVVDVDVAGGVVVDADVAGVVVVDEGGVDVVVDGVFVSGVVPAVPQMSSFETLSVLPAAGGVGVVAAVVGGVVLVDEGAGVVDVVVAGFVPLVP
jgi:hypothetical protein